MEADCKSVGLSLRRFESFTCHQRAAEALVRNRTGASVVVRGMTTSLPLGLTPASLARALGSGVAGASVSAERNPRALRALGIASAVAIGGLAAAASSGKVDPSGLFGEDTETPGAAPATAPLPVALGIGAGVAAVVAGVSEVGIRGQAGIERWADRRTGHPRLVVGLVSAAASLGIDLVERRVRTGR